MGRRQIKRIADSYGEGFQRDVIVPTCNVLFVNTL